MIRWSGKSFAALCALCCVIIMAMVVLVLSIIIVNGKGALSIDFLLKAPEQGMTAGGVFPAIFGTLALVILMTVVVMPLGATTAIYLHEYARQDSWYVKLVRQAVQNLAGVPSIVFGLFGLGFFIQFCGGGMDRFFYGGELHFGQPAILWASLTMALLTLPTVIVTTEEALRAVPASFREAAYAAGATRFQVVRHIVLPNAVAGILTGGILAVSRGSGEVAPILFTGAAYYLPTLPRHLTDQFMNLGYHTYVMSTQSPDVEATLPLLYGTVLVLLLLTFSLNFLAVLVRAKLRDRRHSRR
jgi:phosphate transport system permease protein